MSKIKIFITGDGSHSLLHEAMNETYHSRHGAVQESQYVFIEKGFQYLVDTQGRDEISILEVGFGTGLNALLTLTEGINTNIRVNYTTIEAFPIPEEIWSVLNYPDPHFLLPLLHRAEWGNGVNVHANFHLLKLHQSLLQVTLPPAHYDLIYFDAFAPNKQPELWELPVLEKITTAIRPGGVFVTYCAKGQLKRDLKKLGLNVESLPGPPGKREMVRALKR